MKASLIVHAPKNDGDWGNLPLSLNHGVDNLLLRSLIERAKQLGCVTILQETAYIDRDFSAVYAAFYAKLFKPLTKFCTRIHFFAADITPALAQANPADLVDQLQNCGEHYLGDVVLRPLTHAPVSSARISARHLHDATCQEVSVKSRFANHILGAEFVVEAMPLSQQDTRTGACAQAAMWMTGRHFNNRHGSPWFSMPDITEVALNPTDSGITQSLPAGSEYLTADNMVRALRAMGRHPVTYVPDAVVNGAPTWMNVRPRDVISRYVDSGIPVILGLQQAGTAIGHGVVAVGAERTDNVEPATFAPSPTAAEYVTHFLVNDDQRGAYCRLPVNAADKSVDYPFCLETDIKFLLVPLPEKVFMTAEAAELVARGMLFQVAHQRKHLAASALPPGTAWDEDPTFYDLLQTNSAFARTYLTYGWKYKARMLRNCSSQQAKAELLGMQLPKSVWVPEFSRPEETAFLDPCKRLVRAHAVVDATGSRLWDSTLFVDAPGLTTAWQYDPRSTSVTPNLIVAADLGSSAYWPKIRGMADYASCSVS